MKISHIFALAGAITLSSVSFAQEEIIYKGTITNISSDSVLTISAEEGHMPKVGQKVDIYKMFQIFGGNGSMGLGDGEVKSVSDEEVKVQVLLYTSTMVKDGKRVPMVKLDDGAELRWTGEGTVIKNYNSAFKAAKDLYDEKRFTDAAVAFTDLMNDYPDKTDWTTYHYRGECFFRLGENENAVADLSKAIELNSEDMQARLFRSFANKRLDNFAETIEDFTWLLENGDLKVADQIFMLKERAYVKKELDDIAGAEADMNAVLELDPDDKQAYNWINQHGSKKVDFPDQSSGHMSTEVISQFDGGYQFKLKPLKEKDAQECMMGSKEGEYSTDITVGTIGKAYSCGDGYRMTECLFEVTSVTKGEIQIKVLYYANSMNNEPIVGEYKYGEQFTFSFILK